MAETKSDPPANSEPETNAEDAFWEKFRGHLDSWFDSKVESMRENGSARTGGRKTLPGIIADLVFPPPKQ